VHEFIKSPDDVLALKVSGTITGEDLDPIMDRVEAIMGSHDKIHVYLETHGISGVQLSALPHYMSRAFPLFGKLGRFGRVAVVADQAWMRVGTRLESAILPNISYRVFGPEERQEALDWALGEKVASA
jgi:SpoIIAA-like